MRVNDLIDALKCHVARHGDCEVELFISDKKDLSVAASLALVKRGGDGKHPRALLIGVI